jgi:hypothetical protein
LLLQRLEKYYFEPEKEMVVLQGNERCETCRIGAKPFERNTPGVWANCNNRYGICGVVEGRSQCTRCYWTGNTLCDCAKALQKYYAKREREAANAKANRVKAIKMEASPAKKSSPSKGQSPFGQTNSKFGIGMTTRTAKAKSTPTPAPKRGKVEQSDDDEDEDDPVTAVIEKIRQIAQKMANNGVTYTSETPEMATKSKIEPKVMQGYLKLGDSFVKKTTKHADLIIQHLAELEDLLEQEAEQDEDESSNGSVFD